MYYENSKQIKVGGLSLNYVQTGSGPTLLLLHGIPLCSLTWEANIAGLSKSHTVVALDMPGYGYSDKGMDQLSLPFLAKVVANFMAQLGHDRFAVAGCSYGAAVALTMANNHPGHVSRLVLVNSVGFPSSRHSLAQISRISIMRVFAGFLLRTKSTGSRLFISAARKCYAKKKPDQGELKRYYDIFLHNDGVSSYLKTLVNFNESEIERLLPNIKQKALVVWGTKDKLLPVANAQKFAAGLRDCEVSLMDDCGHMPHEDNPERFNQVVNSFLASEAVRHIEEGECAC